MPQASDNDRWFREELVAHTEPLRRWLLGRFPSISDVENIVQETITRVWRERVYGHLTAPRAMLFTTARNLAVDQLRRHRIAPTESLAEIADLPVYDTEPSPSEAAARNQELELLTEALQSLPDKCRQVLTLRKIYGLSQKEIAAHLQISENTVESQIGNGMRRIAKYLAHQGLLLNSPDVPPRKRAFG